MGGVGGRSGWTNRRALPYKQCNGWLNRSRKSAASAGVVAAMEHPAGTAPIGRRGGSRGSNRRASSVRLRDRYTVILGGPGAGAGAPRLESMLRWDAPARLHVARVEHVRIGEVALSRDVHAVRLHEEVGLTFACH
jgi:hypothetical protein